mgnify:CR=1 FL=1
MFYKNFKNKKKLARINSNFYNFINTSYVAFYTQSVELISNYLIKDLKRIPKHRQYLNNINRILIKQYNIECNVQQGVMSAGCFKNDIEDFEFEKNHLEKLWVQLLDCRFLYKYLRLLFHFLSI